MPEEKMKISPVRMNSEFALVKKEEAIVFWLEVRRQLFQKVSAKKGSLVEVISGPFKGIKFRVDVVANDFCTLSPLETGPSVKIPPFLFKEAEA